MNDNGSERATRSLAAVKILTLLLWLYCTLGCDESRERARGTTRGGSDSNSSGGSSTRPADLSRHGSIVVLGSSTAAGIGPKDSKNAWALRYQAYLTKQFPNVTLINLAVGGQTTFEIQPTDYVPPANRPAPVAGKNITAALAVHPSAIIISLPSNDQANDYPLAEQIANYDRVANLANRAHVPLWVSTTQPRNFDDSKQIDALIQMRDLILQKFAPRALDFWTPFAAPNGFIKGSYNVGDGTHMNDAAHGLLAEIVKSAQIPEQFARSAGASPSAAQ